MVAAILLSLILGSTVSMQGEAPSMPAVYQQALASLGRPGDYKDGVLKVNLARTDLHVVIRNRAVPTPLGFGGWIAFTRGDGDMHVMMGDLVLTEDQVNPVMSALLDRGLEVSALHNHFFWESPRVFYMHVHGHGSMADLTMRVKPAVDLMMSGVAAAPARAAAPPSLSLDGAGLSRIVGAPGEQAGPVYKITIGRRDLAVTEMGAVIGARMGLNTWAAFTGTDADAVIAGDVAMLGGEVPAVLRALRQNGLSVVSIHHHMIGTDPDIYFLHYWGEGPAATLAAGFARALQVLGK